MLIDRLNHRFSLPLPLAQFSEIAIASIKRFIAGTWWMPESQSTVMLELDPGSSKAG
jgi:hypothetical protein